MEQFVKSLYDRLEDKPEKQIMLIGMMDGAINEMHNCGVFARLPEDIQQRVHSDDPKERITIKTAIAKSVAANNFIKDSKPMVLKTGDVAHFIVVKFDPRFINSIAICIQGGLEGLYLSDAYKRCTDEVMHYYIQTDAQGDDYTAFRRKMFELECLYENFQINFMPQAVSPSMPETSKKETETQLQKKGILNRLFGKKPSQKDKHLMISQHAAFYVYQNSESHKKQYINKLIKLGYGREEAVALFNFECDILRRFNKQYLLNTDYTEMWLFGLSQPFFLNYPKEKEDILKEHFLTVSELCKIIDEAEWHFWNSHEKEMPDEVWKEICAWHLKGPGAEFAIKYFQMIAQETGVSEDKIGCFSSNEGGHLSKYKWR